ncbi:hypothetical protein HKBW3S34_02353, partial [Candidatus Hakubella thermalkaliphila]
SLGVRQCQRLFHQLGFTGDEAIMRNYLENKPNILRVRGL